MAFNPLFTLHTENIGKLPDSAKLHFGRFTVLAGPNNTGKSLVLKILYSLFKSLNANHPKEYLHDFTDPIRRNLENLHTRDRNSVAHGIAEDMESPINTLDKKIREMEDLVAEPSWNTHLELLGVINELNDMMRDFPKLLAEIRESLKQPQKKGRSLLLQWQKDRLAELENSLKNLQERLAHMGPYPFIEGGIASMLVRNFTANLQAHSSALRNEKGRDAQIFILGVGKLRLRDQGIEYTIEQDGRQLAQQFSKVLYLDSPMYWTLKNALEDIRLSDRHRRLRRERLTGVPEYFYDLASEFRSKYTGNPDFPKLIKKLTGKNCLGGKIAISDTGEFLFRENDRSFPLALTATGVVNLGILALLIERKILDNNSFVFIDEPETHLHPAWQVVMAETLFELAKGGAHIVIATHSGEILKWLEVHIKHHPDDVGLVALNKFPPDTVTYGEESFEDKMAEIKQALTKPFADLYMKGLGG